MIDILMATYNGEKYIKEQLDSILKQSHNEWRLLIHDDGSTDNTVDLVREYATKYPEKIRFVEDNVRTGGAKNNFFHLMKLSEAEYIMLADQDDIWMPDKVALAYNAILQKETKYGVDMPIMCHSDLKVVDADLKLLDESFFAMQKLDSNKNGFKDILVQNNITGCTAIFNRALNMLCSSMPDEAIMHDWWLGLIASAFGKVFYMDDKAIQYRQHDNNTEGAKNLKSPKYLMKKLLNKQEITESIHKTYIQAEKFYEEYADKLGFTPPF